GTGDWSYSGTSGASNPGSGGNGGGYFRVDDAGSYHSYAYAPSRFLGDWTPLDGTGVVTIDIRVIKGLGTNNGSNEFIRLSGPGGVAHVSLDPSELPTSPRIWKTFTYDVDASVWSLDSGTWTGLLSNITECRIDIEYFTEDEDIGFDSFGRLAAGCPPVDDPVFLYSPHWAKCGYHSFVGCRTVTRNPVNGVLHSIVRETVTYGGGLYVSSGPDAGTYLHAYDRPADALFDGDGNAFISEDYDGEVYRLTPAGASTLWVSGFHGGDDDPWGMEIAPQGFNGPNVTEGDIIVTDRGNGGADEIWTFSPLVPQGELLLMPDPGSVDYFDLAAGPDSAVYMMDALDGTTLQNVSHGGIRTVIPLFRDLGEVVSIVYDTEFDEIYVASRDSACIYRILLDLWDVAKLADGFSDLLHCCLEIDPAGRRLWVADNGYSRIYEFCLEGAVGVAESGSVQPERMASLAIHPNPANPEVTIEFELPATERVMLDVYDVAGRKVRSVLEAELPAGVHAGTWDGRTDEGRRAATGVYFIILKKASGTEIGKAVLLK
ncbi:MAG TPA: FlgD immunoglobulin-like domain containing protein, partial [bacterium]|nr:FlgD immunoglobulin-like domain containing protein [bacterium]